MCSVEKEINKNHSRYSQIVVGKSSYRKETGLLAIITYSYIHLNILIFFTYLRNILRFYRKKLSFKTIYGWTEPFVCFYGVLKLKNGR